jgi:hypothetical protein
MVFMKGTSGLFMQLFRNCDYIPFGGRAGGVLFLITVQRVVLPIGVNYDDQFFFFGENFMSGRFPIF